MPAAINSRERLSEQPLSALKLCPHIFVAAGLDVQAPPTIQLRGRKAGGCPRVSESSITTRLGASPLLAAHPSSDRGGTARAILKDLHSLPREGAAI